MKKFYALVFACLLIASALAAVAEEPQIEGLRSAPKVNMVKGAGKHVLLHTGKPLTEADRKTLRELAIKNSTLKITGTHILNTSFPTVTSTVIFTPDKMYNDAVTTLGNHPSSLQPAEGLLVFAPNDPSRGGSNLTFYINVLANTEYSLACKVRSPQPTPVFTITSWDGTDSINGVHGDNSFGYAFVAQYQGVIGVSISANAYWAFLSCDVTGSTI